MQDQFNTHAQSCQNVFATVHKVILLSEAFPKEPQAEDSLMVILSLAEAAESALLRRV